MKPSARQNTVWNVAIERGRTPWGHVLAFAWSGHAWVVHDPHVRWTEVFTLAPGPEFDAWIADLTTRATIWRIQGRADSHPLAGLFCVGEVKRLTGIRSGAFSPAGLRRDLVRQGARQVFVREGQDSQGRPKDRIGS
ncbi:hypothetical protein KOAAANKH_02541 [Brevundimonas sp. NIBR10]|uniref:hypothetical protein n=1 Tax=Brevundimonas sp. NIBR10 TaxID=3015997 RepID=UPI0022F1D2A8|nr:hypothetical protein [Brevundimonas sp. NIBR10]WGM47659.1 hypothetical protein KOAAANKH_02541 [Brevundimonas sp. NIBR10]